MKSSLIKLLLFFVLTVQYSYSQLADFNLTVTKTDESCTGNGTLTFQTSNTTAGATIIFSVYLLPDVTNPIVVTTNNSISGLSSGNYRVIALQSLGDLSNSQQYDITINDTRVQLVYQANSNPMLCYLTNGIITVNVSQGTALTYEIISGPITKPPQASNLFTNMVPGTYVIRVNDSCGDGIVQTHTINQLEDDNLEIEVVLPGDNEYCTLVDCSTRTITAIVTSIEGTTIHYPIEVQAVVNPPDGSAPIVISQVITSGPPTELIIEIQIPYYNVESYTFYLKAIGTCGEAYLSELSTLDISSSFETAESYTINCDPIIVIFKLCNLIPPFTLNFLTAPAGFDPALFNPNNLGPFNGYFASYSSNDTAQIPYGNYVVQLTDSCGTIATSEINIDPIGSVIPNFVNILCSDNDILNLDDITSIIFLDAPVEFTPTLPYDASGLIDGDNNLHIELPPGHYLISVTTVCGNVSEIEFTILPREFEVFSDSSNSSGCSGSYGYITINATEKLSSVVLLQAPAEYALTLPHDYSSQIEEFSIQIFNLPIGDYVIQVISDCGDVKIITVTVPMFISYGPLFLIEGTGCEIGFGSLTMFSSNGDLTEFVITSAPSSFPFSLPYDCSFNIAPNGFFCMNSLPEGTYTFYSKDQCGVERNETIVVNGFHATENSQIIPNCGSFDIDLQYPNNNTFPQKYWLQKFNTVTSQWEHPLTGVDYSEGSPYNVVNSYPLVNLSVNYNIASVGQFRIVANYLVYQNGSYTTEYCARVIKIFEYTGALNITSNHVISCNSGAIEVAINANGVPPYSYSITTKNGLPFVVNNGNSNLFTGLEEALYNFQIIDACGNILNKLIDINTLEEPTIIPNNLCEGLVGRLSVPSISYLSYQWWKDNDTSTILSATNTLIFNPFSSATTPGTYYVRMYSTTPISCIDKTLSFIVTAISNPNAGQDGQLTVCGNTDPINLFTLLNGAYDANGTWQEITSSGGLSGNMWTPNGNNFGSYTFQYSVTGLCSTADDALVVVNYNALPPVPEINGSQDVCIGQPISLQVNTIPNVTYLWSGPNNFSSNEPIITIENAALENAGEYNVKAFLNGCESEAFVPVAINPNPQFDIEEACVGSNYTIRIIPFENSFNPNAVTYLWFGPNGFSSTQNQIVVTNQETGNYSVTVTNEYSCSEQKAFEIVNVLCEFPNLITPNDDQSNDSFDLTGLEIDKFEIYSRWGRLVYEESDYTNEWHGQNMNNEPLPDSTYYYIIYLRTGEQKHGWVYLAR